MKRYIRSTDTISKDISVFELKDLAKELTPIIKLQDWSWGRGQDYIAKVAGYDESGDPWVFYIYPDKSTKEGTPSDYVNNFRKTSKGFETFDIRGLRFTTNMGSDPLPTKGDNAGVRGYELCQKVDGTYGQTMGGTLDELIAQGYTDIKFLKRTTTVRGFHNFWVAARK